MKRQRRARSASTAESFGCESGADLVRQDERELDASAVSSSSLGVAPPQKRAGCAAGECAAGNEAEHGCWLHLRLCWQLLV